MDMDHVSFNHTILVICWWLVDDRIRRRKWSDQVDIRSASCVCGVARQQVATKIPLDCPGWCTAFHSTDPHRTYCGLVNGTLLVWLIGEDGCPQAVGSRRRREEGHAWRRDGPHVTSSPPLIHDPLDTFVPFVPGPPTMYIHLYLLQDMGPPQHPRARPCTDEGLRGGFTTYPQPVSCSPTTRWR